VLPDCEFDSPLQFAARLGVHVDTVTRGIASGLFVAHRIGEAVRLHRETNLERARKKPPRAVRRGRPKAHEASPQTPLRARSRGQEGLHAKAFGGL
jgi:excisionase family DNA binding protein